MCAVVPRQAADVTPRWVRSRLGMEADPRPGEGVERIGEAFGMASVLVRVRLGVDVTPPSVVVKLWSTATSTVDREARLLQTFGPRLGGRVPRCHDAVVDEDRARAALVMEDLDDVDQGDCLEPAAAERAARIARLLAGVHGTWWASSELATTGWLPRTPWLELQPGWFAPRRERFLGRFASRLTEAGRALLDDLEVTYPRAVERLAGQPQTLLHDDLHLDNVVFDRASGEPILLDWARASIGPAVLDLHALSTDMSQPAARASVLVAYTDELARHGLPRADLDSLGDDLVAASIVSFVRATCGVAGWEPTSPRGRRIIESGIDRAQRAIARSTWP